MSSRCETSLRVTEELLHYNDRLDARPLVEVTTVVLHCTELPTMESARQVGSRVLYPSGTGNSGHLYIDRDGAVYQLVSLDRVAHHVRGHNRESVGIELVNRGRYPHWLWVGSQVPTEQYTEAQYRSCELLLGWLLERLPSLVALARHSDLDTGWVQAEDDPSRRVRRKMDPGPLFDWPRIRAYWSDLAGAPT